MRRYLIKILFALLLFICLVPSMVQGLTIKIDNPLSYDSFAELIYSIINFLFKVSLPVGALMISVSAFYFLTSAGDPEKVRTAKNIILWTLIGIVVLYLSGAIIDLLRNIFG